MSSAIMVSLLLRYKEMILRRNYNPCGTYKYILKKKKKKRWSKAMYSLGILMEILREGEKGMMNKQ